MHWLPTGQTVNKEYYVEVLREFRKRFHRKRPALFKSDLCHFNQDNAPVHNSILVTDYLSKLGIKTVPPPPAIVQNLLPVTFAYSLSSREKLRGCRYETIEEMKEAVTKVIETLTQEDFHGPSRSCWNSTSAWQSEEVTSKGTRVSCVYYQSKCPYEKSLETYFLLLVCPNVPWETVSPIKITCTLVLPLQLFQDDLRCTLMILAPYPYFVKPNLFPNPNFEKF